MKLPKTRISQLPDLDQFLSERGANPAEQLSREPRPFPTMHINPAKTELDAFTYDDFTLENYDPHPLIRADITVVGGFNEEDRKEFQSRGA